MGNGIKVMHVIDNPDHDRVSCLYCPPFLTSDPGDHQHIFIGMNSGNIHIFDIQKLEFTNFTIRCFKSPDKAFPLMNLISDIKCQPEKMHRVLYTHVSSAIIVYSLNKQTKVQQIDLSMDDITQKGKILACEWLYSDSKNESQSFAVGFSEGYVEIFKAVDSIKP